MNSTIIQPGRLAQLLLVESVAPAARIPDPLRSAPEFAPGQKYQATVETHLPNGNFKVLIAGRLLQMNLPESTQPGDRLELVLIAREPRLKFVLLGDARQKAGAEPSLSTTGRFLGALVHDAGRSPAAPALTSPAPLLFGPPADGRLLPELLRQALSRSGLFYESHQAQWVTGKNTLEQLRQEPQGRLAGMLTAPHLPQLKTGTEIKVALLQPGLDVDNTAVAARATQDSRAPAHAQSLALVQQQLAVLETGQLRWRGEVWPGQWMEWDIAERPPSEDKAENETDKPSRWQTRLRLTLPQLGEVAATLALDPRGVRIALDAMATGTAALLQSSRQPLKAAMAAAGLNVLAVEVEMEIQHDA